MFISGVRDTVIGPEVPGFHHLHMKIGTWATDGLLAIFFFLTGLELKKEFAIGDLKSPATAIVPIAAAFGGVITPLHHLHRYQLQQPHRYTWLGHSHGNRHCLRGRRISGRGNVPALGNAYLPSYPGSG